MGVGGVGGMCELAEKVTFFSDFARVRVHGVVGEMEKFQVIRGVLC